MRLFRTKNAKLNFWLDVVIITAFLTMLLYVFFWPVRVVGNSMAPNVNAGDLLIISRFLGFFGEFSHGDLVLASMEENSNRRNAIKRVVGVPFDHIIITDSFIYINGSRLDGIQLNRNVIFVDIVLGDGEYFLLGDNTTQSTDSRHFGPVQRRDIIARMLLRYFPLTSMGIL